MALSPLSSRKKFKVTLLVPISIMVDTNNSLGSIALVKEAEKAFYEFEAFDIKPNSKNVHITTQKIEEIK